MNKEQYFKKSEESNLPKRCPILDVCGRRAWTIYFFADLSKYGRGISPYDKLKNEGIVGEDFEQKNIYVGEEVIFKKSDIHIYYHNVCPEVNLFDNQFSFGFVPKIASTDGDWDDFRETIPKFRNNNCKHFSECPEFAKYQSTIKTTKRPSRKRGRIPKVLRFQILKRDNHRCVYCGRGIVDGVKLHVDHIIPVADNGKTEINNLATSCLDCNLGKGDLAI